MGNWGLKYPLHPPAAENCGHPVHSKRDPGPLLERRRSVAENAMQSHMSEIGQSIAHLAH